MFRHADYDVLIPDVVFAPLASAFSIVIAGLLGLAFHRPWLFASLGPTAFQLAEYPEQKSARAYNTIVGHFSGLAMGFAAVAMLNAWDAPKVLSTHDLTAVRVWASVVAMALTSGLIVLLRASHPPAGSTTLLVSLGSFSTWADVRVVVIGVVIVAAVGEMLRYIRLSGTKK
jgi:hypothetical protein